MKLGKLLSAVAMAVVGMGLALPAQAADPIKIGVYLPLTGQNPSAASWSSKASSSPTS